MSDTSGRTSMRQFAYYDHDLHSWRMWPDTGLWGSIPFSETWPRAGSMSSGRVFERPMLGRRIIVSGCSSLLPTQKACDGILGTPTTTGRPIEKSTHLPTIVKLLPTPGAAMGERGASKEVGGARPSGAQRQVDLNTVAVRELALLPTPEAKNSHAGQDLARANRKGSGGDDLVTAVVKLKTSANTAPLFDVGNS